MLDSWLIIESSFLALSGSKHTKNDGNSASCHGLTQLSPLLQPRQDAPANAHPTGPGRQLKNGEKNGDFTNEHGDSHGKFMGNSCRNKNFMVLNSMAN